MRTTDRLLAVALCLLLVGLPLAAAAPPQGGDDLVISDDEVWDEDAAMDGHVIVQSNASLTVNANISMAMGSSITVEEGGQLVVTNGALLSDDLNAGLMVNNPYASLSLNFGDLADSGVVQLKFDHVIAEGAKMEVTLGDQTVNASGVDIVQFDAPLDGTNLTLTFDSYYFTPTYVLWAKAIYGGGNTETAYAQTIEATNAPLYWFQSGFSIHAHGDFTATSSNILGADIHCKSLCRFDASELTGSAPIDAATTASIVVLDSMLSGSRTDEDIVLHDEASIVYTNNQGTGGSTDAWIRLLSQRTLSTNLPRGSVDVYDMGWGAADWNDLTDDNGDLVLVDVGPTTEHKRIVEWMDGDGVVHQENAQITVSITSSWGVYSKTIDAPGTTAATVNVDLPYVDVTAVSPENSQADVNRSVSGMVTVTNTGSAAADAVSIWCYQDGDVADTTNLAVSLQPGETKDVPFTWYGYTAGAESLTCSPLLPAALNDIADQVVNADGATSEAVEWTYAEEVEEAPIIIYVVVVVGFVGLAFFVASQARKQEKDYDLHDPTEAAPVEVKDDSEHGATAVDNDDESDESEGEASASIYDLNEADA